MKLIGMSLQEFEEQLNSHNSLNIFVMEFSIEFPPYMTNERELKAAIAEKARGDGIPPPPLDVVFRS